MIDTFPNPEIATGFSKTPSQFGWRADPGKLTGFPP